MRKKIISALTFTAVALVSGLIQAEEETMPSVTYLETFSAQLEKVEIQMWEYVKTSAHDKDLKNVNKKRLALLKTVENAKKNSAKVTPYNNDAVYKPAVVKYLTTLEIILREDYGKLINLEEVSEQSYDNMEAYMLARKLANEKLSEAGEELQKSEQAFASQNNINLISTETETSKGMSVANTVMQYHDEVYLAFFKAYKQELYLIQALNTSDLAAIEQNRLSLIKYSDEGLKKIAALKPFEKDNSLLKGCSALLAFYKTEGTDKMPILTDYLLKSDSFEKIKNAFEAKKQNERTQADVDLYNSKVKEINTASDNYNKTNAELNTQRGTLIDQWNNNSRSFLDIHIPK